MVSHWAGQPARAVWRELTAALAAADVPDADFDAQELVRSVTGRSPQFDTQPLTAPQAEQLAAFCQRRQNREPLQYLLGEWDFLDFTLKCGPGVLCPRADTEVVCETAIALLQAGGKTAPAVLDLCAGTGCLGLGIRRFVPGAQVTCVELSDAALPYLKENAAHALARWGGTVTVISADVMNFWQTLPPESVDLIVSNPPYLTAAEMHELMPETAQEPAMALDGGEDGLVFYRLLVEHYQQALVPGGWLVLEIGWQQAEAVLALGAACGWVNGSCKKDYGGNDRVVVLQKPKEI